MRGVKTMTKEAVAHAPSGRPKRIPVGTRGKLNVYNKDEDNFHYRIVNDVDATGDRIQAFKEAGYELVSTSGEQIDNFRLSDGKPDGTVKSFNVGSGIKAYLMRIPKEWHEEDMEALRKQNEELVKQQTSSGQDYVSIKTTKPTSNTGDDL